MKLTVTEQQQVDAKVDIITALRRAADEWDNLPAWRRWLAERLSNRKWGYELRVWADLAVRRDDADRRNDGK